MSSFALVIPAITGAAVALVGQEIYEVIKERLGKKMREYGPAILQEAVDRLGIQLDASGGLTDEALTAAINQSLLTGTGIELTSVLDGQKMKQGLEGVALAHLSDSLGLPPVNSRAEIRGALQGWIGDEMARQVLAQSGPIVDAAKELTDLKKRMAAVKDAKNDWNTPVDFTPAGISNRERQRRYRLKNKKHWVVR